MKNNRFLNFLSAKSILLALGIGISAFAANAQITTQMSGSYTINTGIPCSATNFKNLYSFIRSLQGLTRSDTAVASLQYNSILGVAGAITLDYKTNTTEATQISIPQILGMSASNTVTINGNSFTALHSAVNACIQFTGGDYFTINNLLIQSTAATPGGFWFNNQSDYNTISGCKVYFSALVSANSTVSYVSFSTGVTSPTSYASSTTGTAGQPGSYNTITGCKFYTQSGSPGPYYAITLNGNSSNYISVAQNNTFTGNTITNFNYAAVYMYYTNGNVVSNNDISRNDATAGGQTTFYGIYSYYPYCTTRASVVSGNTIHDLPFAGATTATSNLSSFYLTYIYYPTGTASNHFVMDGNTYKNIYATTGTCYTNYVYYPVYIDITNNVIDNIQVSGASSSWYNWYVYYPTAIKCNGNTIKNCISNYYLYNFYLYYGTTGTYTWNEFSDNVITNNVSVNYMYNAYLYYYNGTNSWIVNRNYIVGNKVTGSTGYMYFYLYYYMNYVVCDNVVAGNFANSQYFYIYSGNSGSYTAEVRNNTFQADMTGVPTPGSSYIYGYFYLYYQAVWFTGNVIDFKGTGTQYYRYLYMYLSYATPSNLYEFNNNTYSLNNLFSYPYWYFNGTNYTDWAGFSSGGVAGAGDNGDDPLYIDKVNGDWRTGAWSLQNNVPYVSTNIKDAKQNLRNKTRHDRGGLETPTDLQAVATNFTVPAVVCAGYTTTGKTYIIVKSNYAYDKATNFNVSYALNGGPKISTKVTKKLAKGDTVLVYFTKQLVLNQTGNARIAIFVDLPDDINTNDSFIFNTFVKPAPGGGRFSFSPKPTVAYYQQSKTNDITILKAPAIYTVNAPRIYSNTNFGTAWTATAYAVTTGGNARPTSEITWTAPSGSNDMEIKFQTSDAAMEDSSIWVVAKISDLTNGCDTFIRRQVLIYPTIVPKFIYPAKICNNDAVLFENKSTVRSGNIEFSWDFGTGKAKDASQQQDPLFIFPAPGTYKVKMTAKTLPYGFPSYDSATITVDPIPSVDFLKANACEGKNLTFTNLTSPATATYSWNFGDATAKSTLKNPTHTYAKTGTYNVTLTSSLNGCTASASQFAYQFDKPVAKWNYVSGTCDNDLFTFSNVSTIKSGLYGSNWDFTAGDVSTDLNPKHMFTSPGTKNIKLIVTSEFGCKDSLTKSVVVKESPKPSFTNTPACSLTPTQFVNQTTPVAGTTANYLWNFGDGSATTAAVSPIHTWSSLGTKTITMTVTLDNSCKATISKDLTVGIQPKADFMANNVCAGSPVVFENSTTWAQGDINYNWNFADATTSTASDPTHDYGIVSKTSTFLVTLYAGITGGCSDSITKAVTVNESPKTCDFKFDADYLFGRNGMKFQALDNSTGNVGGQSGVSYTWVIESSGNKTGASVQHDFLKDGSYTVTMRAKVDATGCECTKTKQVIMNRAQVQDLETVGVSLFPNPSNGNFNIALSETFGTNISIEVMTITGSVVKTMNTVNSGMVVVDAGTLADGNYMVRVRSGNRVVTRKINIRR